MAMDDWMRCTPAEFMDIWDAWNEMHERQTRDDWERARMTCLCSLQPYSGKKLKARDVMQFPWDEKEPKRSVLTAEEIAADKRHYEEVKKARGLK